MALLEAAGYYCTRSGGGLGLFDIVDIGSTDSDVYEGSPIRILGFVL